MEQMEEELFGTEERLEKFAEEYGKLPVLWHNNDKDSEDDHARVAALHRLLAALGQRYVGTRARYMADAVASFRSRLYWQVKRACEGAGASLEAARAQLPAWAQRADSYLQLLANMLPLTNADEQTQPAPRPEPCRSPELPDAPAPPALPAAEQQRAARLMRRVVRGMRREAPRAGLLGRAAAARVALRLGEQRDTVYTLWMAMQRQCVHKLRARTWRNDAGEPLSAAEWAVADLAVAYGGSLLTSMHYQHYRALRGLLAVFHLVQRFGLEPAPGQPPPAAAAWAEAAAWYSRDPGRAVASGVVLQRRWYELRADTRRRLQAAWRSRGGAGSGGAGGGGAAPARPVLALHEAVAGRYPHVVTGAAPASWARLLRTGQLAPLTSERGPAPGTSTVISDSTDSDSEPDHEGVLIIDEEIKKKNRNKTKTRKSKPTEITARSPERSNPKPNDLVVANLEITDSDDDDLRLQTNAAPAEPTPAVNSVKRTKYSGRTKHSLERKTVSVETIRQMVERDKSLVGTRTDSVERTEDSVGTSNDSVERPRDSVETSTDSVSTSKESARTTKRKTKHSAGTTKDSVETSTDSVGTSKDSVGTSKNPVGTSKDSTEKTKPVAIASIDISDSDEDQQTEKRRDSVSDCVRRALLQFNPHSTESTVLIADDKQKNNEVVETKNREAINKDNIATKKQDADRSKSKPAELVTGSNDGDHSRASTKAVHLQNDSTDSDDDVMVIDDCTDDIKRDIVRDVELNQNGDRKQEDKISKSQKSEKKNDTIDDPSTKDEVIHVIDDDVEIISIDDNSNSCSNDKADQNPLLSALLNSLPDDVEVYKKIQDFRAKNKDFDVEIFGEGISVTSKMKKLVNNITDEWLDGATSAIEDETGFEGGIDPKLLMTPVVLVERLEVVSEPPSPTPTSALDGRGGSKATAIKRHMEEFRSFPDSFFSIERNVRQWMRCKPCVVALTRASPPRARAAKRVELPDIAAVRRAHRGMLTAQVAPLAQRGSRGAGQQESEASAIEESAVEESAPSFEELQQLLEGLAGAAAVSAECRNRNPRTGSSGPVPCMCTRCRSGTLAAPPDTAAAAQAQVRLLRRAAGQARAHQKKRVETQRKNLKRKPEPAPAAPRAPSPYDAERAHREWVRQKNIAAEKFGVKPRRLGKKPPAPAGRPQERATITPLPGPPGPAPPGLPARPALPDAATLTLNKSGPHIQHTNLQAPATSHYIVNRDGVVSQVPQTTLAGGGAIPPGVTVTPLPPAPGDLAFLPLTEENLIDQAQNQPIFKITPNLFNVDAVADINKKLGNLAVDQNVNPDATVAPADCTFAPLITNVQSLAVEKPKTNGQARPGDRQTRPIVTMARYPSKPPGQRMIVINKSQLSTLPGMTAGEPGAPLNTQPPTAAIARPQANAVSINTSNALGLHVSQVVSQAKDSIAQIPDQTLPNYNMQLGPAFMLQEPSNVLTGQTSVCSNVPLPNQSSGLQINSVYSVMPTPLGVNLNLPQTFNLNTQNALQVNSVQAGPPQAHSVLNAVPAGPQLHVVLSPQQIKALQTGQQVAFWQPGSQNPTIQIREANAVQVNAVRPGQATTTNPSFHTVTKRDVTAVQERRGMALQVNSVQAAACKAQQVQNAGAVKSQQQSVVLTKKQLDNLRPPGPAGAVPLQVYGPKMPQVTTSQINGLQVNTLQVTAPQVHTPQVSALQVNTRQANGPQVYTPQINKTQVNTPLVSASQVNIQQLSAPSVSETQVNSRQVNGPQVNTPQFSGPQVSISQPGTTGVDISQAGTPQVGISQAGTAQVAISQAGTAQVGISVAGTPQVAISQAGTAQVGISVAGTPQVAISQAGTPQVAVSQAGTPQVAISQAGTAQAGISQACTPQIGISQAGTPKVTISLVGAPAAGASADKRKLSQLECDDDPFNESDWPGLSAPPLVSARDWLARRPSEPAARVVLAVQRGCWRVAGCLVLRESSEPPSGPVYTLRPLQRLLLPEDSEEEPGPRPPPPAAPPAAPRPWLKVKDFAKLAGDGLPPKPLGPAPRVLLGDGVHLKIGDEPLAYAKVLIPVSGLRECGVLLLRRVPLQLYSPRTTQLAPLSGELDEQASSISLIGPSEMSAPLQRLARLLNPALPAARPVFLARGREPAPRVLNARGSGGVSVEAVRLAGGSGDQTYTLVLNEQPGSAAPRARLLEGVIDLYSDS